MAATAKPTYYAVPDPDTGDMTYWMRTGRGELKAWPTRRYDTRLCGKPYVWMAAIRGAIEANPDVARARFAAFTSHCCICGKFLTDEASKVWGIGPDCRQKVSADFADACAGEIARLHGLAGGAPDDNAHVAVESAAAMVEVTEAARAAAPERVVLPVGAQLPLLATAGSER